MDQVLLTIPEIREVRQLAKNYNPVEFAGYIREVQRKYLEPLIGSALYLDMLNNTSVLTSGLLTIGDKYKITDYKSDDDFTNVGASSNETGVVFTATGTTPTKWASSSSLQTTSSIYFDLLEGKQYTYGDTLYNFYGAKMYLIYLFLYLYFKEGDLNYTDSGKKTYNAENSTDARTNLNSSIINNHFNSAKVIGESITEFLEYNKDLYPLYKSTDTNTDVNYRFDFKVLSNNYRRDKIII